MTAFKEHFEDSDRYATALAKLRKLKQAPGSASSHASRFRELSWELELTNQTSIQMFYDGLKDNVKDTITVALIKDVPTDFDDYVKEVVIVDNRLHHHQVKRQDGSKSVKTPSPSTPRYSIAPSFSSAPTASSSLSTDVVLMEIDATKHGPVTPEEKARRRSLGLCFYCGGQHLIDNCPNMSEAAKKKFKANKAGKASKPSGKV